MLLSPPSRKRQGGVKVGLMNERIGKSATTTEYLRSSRYWGSRVPHAKLSPRLSVRFTTTGASPTLPIYIVPSAQCRCSFAPICLTRLPGRTEARPYDRMVSSAMYYVENKHSRVAACCDLPGDGFSLVLQSLRLSTDNEQNLCNLAHCGLIFRLIPT